jgi:hypothetical protein
MSRRYAALVWAAVAGAALTLAVAALPAFLAQAAGNPNFAGKWELVPAESTNLGMMAAVKLDLQIAQTANTLAIKETSVFQGKATERVVGYDLNGKPIVNQGPMGDSSETIAHWEDGKLVVTWTSNGTLPGTRLTRTETRWLSADGRTMSVQMARGEGPAVIMVFDRKK